MAAEMSAAVEAARGVPEPHLAHAFDDFWYRVTGGELLPGCVDIANC